MFGLMSFAMVFLLMVAGIDATLMLIVGINLLI